MAKPKAVYECQACGHATPKWTGKCPDCGAWNSLSEAPAIQHRRGSLADAPVAVRLDDIHHDVHTRLTTGIAELDGVLGGGIVPGSVTLIGGDPGIGKSTLVLQALVGLSGPGDRLYVSAEESPDQIRLRAERLRMPASNLLVLPATRVGDILKAAHDIKPSIIVVDSIQMVHDEELASAPGTVSQVREASAKLTAFAKRTGVPVIVVGHVTKDGALAGPKVLEHIVDTVLYFEGDSSQAFRILRAVKNRFGSTNEIGVFSMTGQGLAEVRNPSELFLAEHSTQVSGSVVTASMEGTRPIMVEIQALVSPSSLGIPRRTTLGIDSNRTSLLLAVLEKRAGLSLSAMDVYINVVGGLRLDDTATDLGIVLAATSSFRERPVPREWVAFGEIGLSGELRAVAQAESRVKEAARLGFKKVLMPKANASRLENAYKLEILGLETLSDAVSTTL